jgi:hypothetical protein
MSTMHSRRRLVPLFFVAGLGFLTVAAAAFGASGSPRLFFASVPPNDAKAHSQLQLAIERTASASSFTLKTPRKDFPETLIYNAPDRIHDYLGSEPLESYGSGTTYYFRLSDYDLSDSESNRWVQIHKPPHYSSARIYAMRFLTSLSGAQSVRRHGDRLVAYSIISNDPYSAGDIRVVLVVQTSHGTIKSINATTTGFFPQFNPHFSTSQTTVTFFHIGTSPHIVLPRARIVSGDPPPCGPVTSGFTFCAA